MTIKMFSHVWSPLEYDLDQTIPVIYKLYSEDRRGTKQTIYVAAAHDYITDKQDLIWRWMGHALGHIPTDFPSMSSDPWVVRTWTTSRYFAEKKQPKDGIWVFNSLRSVLMKRHGSTIYPDFFHIDDLINFLSSAEVVQAETLTNPCSVLTPKPFQPTKQRPLFQL